MGSDQLGGPLPFRGIGGAVVGGRWGAHGHPLDDALTAIRAAGTHLAAVTGDKATLLGFVTMTDVLENSSASHPPHRDPDCRR